MIFLFLLSCISNDYKNYKYDKKDYTEVHNENKGCLNKVIENSVKIVNSDGSHGSGTLMKNKDNLYVFTANHVVNEKTAKVDIYGVDYLSKVVFSDPSNDFLILELEGEIQNKKGIEIKEDQNIEIGEDLFFIGNPSHRNYIFSFGTVSGFPDGFRDSFFYIQSYGWFGSSGSVVFNNNCEIMGIVSSIVIEQEPIPAVHENAMSVGRLPNKLKEFLK